MPGTHDLTLFVISGLLLNITPGADFVYVLTRAATQGFRAGAWASLGIGAGCGVHILAAALGLSAILASSATAFAIIKWIGAAYLAYLGLTMLLVRRQDHLAARPALPPAPSSRIFWQGFLTNLLNPKVALFFLAFVPQFIDASSPGKVTAFLFLGAVFNLNGTLWNLVVAWAAAGMAGRLGAAATAGIWMNRLLGTFFIALGVRLALSERA